ncbi:MAG: tRNA (N6-threonylcarbamoyladenosine(37)-N6)-methyltransferase TrmO [Anaerolineae bacterium]|nr:tRNA (N6-threonylcarbamoyladenosine(37)-N6)-methyltransferase TrmO [Anaerolineae bacterium]
MSTIVYEPIGIVHSPFKEPRGTPIQPPAAAGVEGTVELEPAYLDGLKDLDGFSHIILLYHFHQSKPASLRVRPFMDDEAHGVFAMRGPSRPNPIGLSVVRLERVEGNLLRVKDVDIVDGTPLLDIKPYVPQFDARDHVDVRIGWLGENVQKLSRLRDDGRFAE